MHDSAQHILKLYDRHAQAWIRKRGKSIALERKWLQQFLRHVPAGGDILDCGCGSGQPIAHHLANAGYKLTGIDGAPRLIEACRALMPDHTWIVGTMLDATYTTRFHGLIAWHSLFHLTPDDQKTMLAKFTDLARPMPLCCSQAGEKPASQLESLKGNAFTMRA